MKTNLTKHQTQFLRNFSLWLFYSANCIILSCQPSQKPEIAGKLDNHWPHAGVTYEIFIRSFYDSDGDGIGDINGVRKKLAHVTDLGANAIWFMPIMPSPSYHKYDVTDYTSIHPDYGTLEDFKALIEEAHAMDISIVIDLIINHTSSEHPWFLEAKKGRENPHRDYFVWAQKDTLANYLEKKIITLDSDNIRQWHYPGHGEDYYYGFFYGGMPDLNFDNPKVRQEIYEIGQFWLEEVGVDGFRLDAAKHIFPDDRAADNHSFWKEFRKEMEIIKPDVYLVGEVYDSKEIVAPFLPGLPALFNFDFHYSLLEALRSGDGAQFPAKQKQVLDYYRDITTDFIDATISSNHDQPRILSDLGGDDNMAKQAIVILMTMPGAPYLYYGEEIGMLGNKPDPNIREPYLWDLIEKDEGRTSWIEPVFSTDETVVPLEIQKKDSRSMYRHYQEIIRLRNSDQVLALGNLEEGDSSFPRDLMTYKRSLNGQQRHVFHNVGQERLEIAIPEGIEVLYSFNGAKVATENLIFPPQSSLILVKK